MAKLIADGRPRDRHAARRLGAGHLRATWSTGTSRSWWRPGASPRCPALLAALDDLGIGPDDLAHVVVTHIHLDHAGGVGDVARAFPKATVHVHEKGARHLVDPTQLVDSAAMVYGDLLDSLYGRLDPDRGRPGPRAGGRRGAAGRPGPGADDRRLAGPRQAPPGAARLGQRPALRGRRRRRAPARRRHPAAGHPAARLRPGPGPRAPSPKFAGPPPDRHRPGPLRPGARAEAVLDEATEILTRWAEVAEAAWREGRGHRRRAGRRVRRRPRRRRPEEHREKLETLNGIHSNAAGFRRWLDKRADHGHPHGRTTTARFRTHAVTDGDSGSGRGAADGDRGSSWSGTRSTAATPSGLVVDVDQEGDRTTWSVANTGDHPVAVDQVALVFAAARRPLPAAALPQRLPVVVGHRRRPPSGWTSTRRPTDTLPFLRDMHHADRDPAAAGDLRSEQVTVLRDHDGTPALVGFLGGRHHDGTIRLRARRRRASRCGPRPPSAAPCSAPGTRRTPAPGGRAVRRRPVGPPGPVGGRGRRRPSRPARRRRTRSAGAPGTTTSTASPRPTSPPTWPGPATGPSTCSSSTTATSPRSATGWPPTTSSRPAVDGVASAIAAAGFTPGHLDRAVHRRARRRELAPAHPEWLAREADDPTQPMIGMFNDIWGGVHERPRRHPARGARPPGRRRPATWSTPATATSSWTSRSAPSCGASTPIRP